MSGLNSRTFNGLRVPDNTKLLSPLVSGELNGSGEANIEGFDSAAFNHVSNQHGELLVNSITAQAPLENRLENGLSHVSIKIDDSTMLIKEDGALASKRMEAEFPLGVQENEEGEGVLSLQTAYPLGVTEDGLTLFTDDSLVVTSEGILSSVRDSFETPLERNEANQVRLKFKEPLVVEDDQLTVDTKEIAKGAGAIRIFTANDIGGIAPDMPDWLDIELPLGLDDYLQNGMLVKLQVSDDFQQTGGRLALRSSGLYRIPFYSALSGFDSDANFTYNNTLNLVTSAYAHQLYQSQAGSAIDISDVVNGRKHVKVNHDDTLVVDETNRLGVDVSNIVDSTSVKAMNGKLSVDPYLPGDGITIADNVVSSTLTYGGSLRREGDQVIGKTDVSASSNITVVQTNPFSYEVSVLNPQSQIDNLEDKVDDLNEKTDQNKVETDNKLNDLETEDVRLDDRIDGVESRVQQQENKTDLLSNDITTNRSNITALDNAKNQIQGDLISLAGDVTGLTGVVDTVNTVATGVQIAQQVMSGNLTSLQGVVTGIAGEVTGLSSTVAAIQAMPVVRGVIGIGVIAAQDPITGVVTITASSPLMAKSKGTAPVDPILKSDDSILKDNGGLTETGETAPPVDPPILPPNPPPPPPGGDTLRTTGGTDGNNYPCLDPIPPIFGGNDVRTNEQTWFRDSWGKRWQLPTIEVDGVPKTVLEYDENNLPIVPHGHIDIVHRKTEVDDFSSVLLTHDRHLQSGYQGVRLESMLQVPNLAMLFESWDFFMQPYVESCNYIGVGQGLVKTGNTLSLSEDLSTFAKTSSIKALGFKDTLSYSELAGRPTDLTTKTYVDGLSYLTAGTGITKSGSSLSVNSSAITSVGTLTGLTSSGIVTISNATAAINSTTGALRVTGGASFGGNLFAVGNITAASPTATGHLCTKSYVDGLSYIAVGTGLVKSGNTISLGSDLSTFALKSDLQSFAYKSSLSYAEVTGKPDLSIYETKTTLKGLAYKDKVDYATDVINAPVSVTYGSGLLFSENALSLNPALNVDSLATVGGISVGGNLSAVGNVSIGALVEEYTEATETGGVVIDDVGDVDISQRLSIGMGNEFLPFPPVDLWANTGVVSAQPYGNGTYVVSSSSKFNNSTQYDAWHAFTDNSALYPWYPLTGTYNVDSPFNYVGSISTTVDGVEVLGEWIQLQLPLPILLQSFDIAVLNVTTNFYIKEFVLVGSNDDTTFTQLMTSTFSWGAAGAQTLNVPVPNVTKGFKTYRLITKSLLGNRTYCQVSRLIFYGKPVSMEIRGAISAKQILTDELVCSGDVKMDGLGLQDDIPTTSVYPDTPMTASTTGQYTATSSSVYSGTWTAWKVYNPYASDNNNTWFSAADAYSTTAPFSHIGTASTTVDGSAVSGEWVQLDMQTAIALTSFYIAEPTTGDSYNVKDFIIAGSSDGSSWKQVVSGTLDWSTAPSNGSIRELNVPVTTRVSHKSYRFITRSIQGESAGKYAQIYALKYTGGIPKKVLNVENLKVNKIFGDLSIDNSIDIKDDIVSPLRYPQIPLTGGTTQGYIVNASSNLNGTSAAWKAFTNSLEINDSYWSSSTYSGGTQNLYQGQGQTTVNGINFKGEYVELEMPNAIAITAFTYAGRTPEMPMFPKDYTICASDDRSNWTELSSGPMTYTMYQNSTSVDRFVPIKNYTTKKFKIIRFIVRNLVSSTYAHIGKLTFYGSTTTLKSIDAPSAKINNVALTAPAYGMFQLHSSQAFSVNGTAYQLITKWTPSFGMESETITCSPNSQDIVFSMPGIYKIEFDLDCHQSASGVVNSYFGFMAPGNPQYYEDGYHVRKISMIAGQRVTGSSICRVVEADTKMILRFNSGSSSGAITGSPSSRLIVYRIAPLA
ncbi:hypothetical protein BC832DRAFT_594530 [Gaertneriomyces semiglobifer]|nr:hypothetical protein BC832DRAFT_594530 [Gaertneriomyces semiglobifer]